MTNTADVMTSSWDEPPSLSGVMTSSRDGMTDVSEMMTSSQDGLPNASEEMTDSRDEPPSLSGEMISSRDEMTSHSDTASIDCKLPKWVYFSFWGGLGIPTSPGPEAAGLLNRRGTGWGG